MARIRKIPDTWTLEIHAIVLKDSRQAEHKEIGCMNTTKQAQNIRTSNVVGEELKRKKRSKQNDTTRQSSAYSNIKRGGRGAQKKETLETKRHDKTKLSVLKHQTWWERSSKERNARNKTTRQNKLSVLKHQTGWERSSKERNARNKTTRQNKLSVLEHQTWWERSSKEKETLETERHDKAKRMSRGKEDQTFEPSWPNGEYLWISSETRKELISRPKNDDAILVIRIIRCRSIIRHARRPYDYDAILLIRIIRCRSIRRHAKQRKEDTHT